LIRPLWSFANVHLEIRNAGITGHCGDTHQNSIWCFRNILGDDTDIAHYEWTYMENHRTEPDINHERWLRWLLMMKHSPPGHFFTVGTGTQFNCLGAWDRSKKRIPELYGQFGANILCLDNGLKLQGYNKLTHEKRPGDGLHISTRYANEASPSRKKSLSYVYRNWHPGPLGFQMIADTFAYYYGNAMLLALDKIENIAEKNTENTIMALRKKWPRRMKPLSYVDLPPPAYCEPRFCNVMPNCIDFEYPTFGEPQITIIPVTNGSNIYREMMTGLEIGWDKYEASPTTLIPKPEKKLSYCKHKDRCGSIRGRGRNSGWLSLDIPPLSVGRIVLCSLKHSTKWKLFGSDLVVMLQKKRIHMSERKLIWQKCLQVQSAFPSNEYGEKLKNTPLQLGIFVKSRKQIDISHVIAI